MELLLEEAGEALCLQCRAGPMQGWRSEAEGGGSVEDFALSTNKASGAVRAHGLLHSDANAALRSLRDPSVLLAVEGVVGVEPIGKASASGISQRLILKPEAPPR
jgi:hypothetical protein